MIGFKVEFFLIEFFQVFCVNCGFKLFLLGVVVGMMFLMKDLLKFFGYFFEVFGSFQG